MVRDARMQALVHKSCEPITPFVDRIHELYVQHGVSSVLVMGGCGDYFDSADRVVMMSEYIPEDVTLRAHQITTEIPSRRINEVGSPFRVNMKRIPDADSYNAKRGKRDVKIDIPVTFWHD